MAKIFLTFCLILLICLITFAFTSYRKVEYLEAKMPKLMYEEIKDRKASNVSPILNQIVVHRILCSTQELMDKKWSYCTSRYTNDVFSMVKSTSDTMSEKTKLVQCIRRCPTVYEICNNNEDKDADCAEMEAMCLEYCTDHQWRKYYQIHEYTIW